MACRALRNLAANNDNNEDAISAAGGIEALATAMETHQARALLQEYACAALYHLACNARLRERIKAAGGVELAKRAVSASDATALTKDWGKRLLD
jgi:dihydroorotate dehydrogenase